MSLHATDPRYSVWVTASAGTGKTYLLTSRFLRLLLAGVAADSILCVTFTQYAAEEMHARIASRLQSWALAGAESVADELTVLLGESPTAAQIQRAQTLYVDLLDNATNLKIMTLHSFCWSLLNQFPSEAGLEPGTRVMSDIERLALIEESCQRLWKLASQPEQPCHAAIRQLSGHFGGFRLQQLCAAILAERAQFTQATNHEPLYALFGLKGGDNENALITEFIADKERRAKLLEVAELQENTALYEWWSQPQPNKIAEYVELFVTKQGTPRKKLASASFTKSHPAMVAILLSEQERVMTLTHKLQALQAISHSKQLLIIANTLLPIYQELCARKQRIDFDTIITQAAHLLSHPELGPWVQYRVGARIAHILVDEAQDTSLAQWQVIHALTQDFFSAAAGQTLLVVGDAKQSIYSFQGADPALFMAMQQFYQNNGAQFKQVTLAHSYRSAPAILEFVDAWANQAPMLASLTQNSAKVEHIPYHQTRAGWVAVWPLVGQSEEGLEVTQSWQVPAVEPQRNHPEIILARQIASTIASWLNDGRMLVSKQRPLSPGDILILVRKRNQFIDELVRELKALQIPASGSDRLKLQDSLAIQDMLALMRFVALPDDDFSLAAVLKGPLCAVSEEQLFKLAYARGKTSLWERLLNEPEQADIAARLKRILAFADCMRPAKLLGFVLDSKPGRAAWYARQGDEALDMFAALLSLAEEYEQTSNASLEGFINFVENYEESVKRILEQNQQMVRIMTAHGAKGLQAPIVFVADSVVPPRNRDTFCWLGAEPALPVIYSKDNNALPAIAKQLAEENCRQLDEYRRLFYVAITRAECGLVLCGAAKRNEVSELSWYSQGQAILEHGLGDLDSVLAPGEHVEPSSNPPVIMPEFAEYKQTAQEEEHLLLPSLLGERAEASAQMQLGLLLHQVLEFAERYRSDHAALLAFLTNHQAEDFYAEMLSTLKDPHLEAFLAPTSIAEVPLYGTIIFAGKQRLLSGRIDRLLVQEDRVLFIDFKTHRQPPKALTASMLSQMQLYQAALIQMYPQKQVRGYIYFTATQELRALQSEMV